MKTLTFQISYMPSKVSILTAKDLKTAGIWESYDGSYNERITAKAHWDALRIAESKGAKASATYIETSTDLVYCH